MIEILNQQRRYNLDLKSLEKLLKSLAVDYKLKNPEITLVLVNDKAIRELNLRYRKKDKPTDVLSFSMGEKGADGKFYLGDIVISVPQAARQHRAKDHDLQTEVELLTVHGFLHLLGYEHFQGLEEEESRVRNRLHLEDHGS
jgi:probable rRNA maturation factor